MLREGLFSFIIALVVGSLINGYNQVNADVGSAGAGSSAVAVRLLPMVNDANFKDEVVNSSTPVLVDFYTDDCPHCRKMAPVLADLAGQLNGVVKVVRLDAMSSPQLAEKYGVEGFPTFVLFKNGEKVDVAIGEMPKDELLSFIRKYTSSPTSPPPGAALPG